MFRKFWKNPLACLAIGLWVGLLAVIGVTQLSPNQPMDLAGFWPETPIHATATDRCETVAMATGPVDEEVEAVYILDFLTGELNAFVLGKLNNGFQAKYTTNVMAYMQLDPSRNPRFMMVTGLVTMRRGAGGQQPSLAAVYVAEVTTAQLAAFVIPWQVGLRNINRPVNGQLVPMGKVQFRAVRPGAGAGPAVPKRVP